LQNDTRSSAILHAGIFCYFIAMSFIVNAIEFDDPHHCLREMLHTLRTGAFRGLPEAEIPAFIARTLNRLKEEVKKTPHLFDEVEQLRLLTLEAEFHQLNGRFDEAAGVLRPTWERLKPHLDRWSRDHPLEPTDNRDLRRQKIWALLFYVFCYFHRKVGNQAVAKDYYERIAKIIRRELHTDAFPAYGTLALCQYFLGVCFDVMDSSQAERYLLEAQANMFRRVAREFARADISEVKKHTLLHRDVFAARILSAVARVAIQQGALVHAENVLYGAQDLLAHTHHASLKRLINVLIWTAARRRLPYSEAAYENRIGKLAEYYAIYKDINDPTGQVRCASEIVRGYLDWAEFSGEESKPFLISAEKWLQRIPDHIPYAAEMLRCRLLRARYFVLRGETQKAREVMEEVGESGVPGECKAEWDLAKAAIHLNDSPLSVIRAGKLIAQRLKLIRSRREATDASESHRSPVIEAECYLLLARTAIMERNYAVAQKRLANWLTISHFVDNHYLHRQASQIEKQLTRRPPRFERDFTLVDPRTGEANGTVKECLADYEAWIRKILAERHGITRKVDLAPFYNKHPANIDRKRRTTE
jgi:hypothetical protein